MLSRCFARLGWAIATQHLAFAPPNLASTAPHSASPLLRYAIRHLAIALPDVAFTLLRSADASLSYAHTKLHTARTVQSLAFAPPNMTLPLQKLYTTLPLRNQTVLRRCLAMPRDALPLLCPTELDCASPPQNSALPLPHSAALCVTLPIPYNT